MDENSVTKFDRDGGPFKWLHGWPAVSDGFVWDGERGDRPESQHLVHKSTEDRKSVSVAIFWVAPLQHCAQLLVHFGLHLQESNTAFGLRFDVVVFVFFVETLRPASGLCKRKATVQFSQAAVVSVPPMRRSTVAMCTWTSVRHWRGREWVLSICRQFVDNHLLSCTRHFSFCTVLLVQAPEEGPQDCAVVFLLSRLRRWHAPLQKCH